MSVCNCEPVDWKEEDPQHRIRQWVWVGTVQGTMQQETIQPTSNWLNLKSQKSLKTDSMGDSEYYSEEIRQEWNSSSAEQI